MNLKEMSRTLELIYEYMLTNKIQDRNNMYIKHRLNRDKHTLVTFDADEV